MRHGIVEGEPGIFPQPVFRVLRAVGRLFGRGGGRGGRDGGGGGRRGEDRRAGSEPPGRSPVEDVVGVPDVADLDPVRPDRADPPPEPATGEGEGDADRSAGDANA